ncbi:gamma-secretase subunit pen-2 [Epargyreus clarus]|uniref:gamma-secretase subunit pen-2 n=1 Tax=Epargyreus clarus TaxID=520877 RepID=UPI003C3023FE
MDLNKIPNDQKLDLCRWYFKVGLFFLPFVWAVNSCWFFKEAFIKPPYEQQKQIKKYVIASGIGCLVWTVALAVWTTLYQTQRVSWGAVGDTLSFITPLGRP